MRVQKEMISNKRSLALMYWIIGWSLIFFACDEGSHGRIETSIDMNPFDGGASEEAGEEGGEETSGTIIDLGGGAMTDRGLDNDRDMTLRIDELDQNFFPDAEVFLDARVPPPACEIEGEGATADPSLEQKKFALSMFHYNLEYVIGGLYYDDDSGERQYILGNESLAMGWDNDRLEDWIITETFDPILELYEAHPGWQVTIELQGYMLEVLAERHPGILDRFRRLTQSGQVEAVSFHYAAQLFLAFPKEDLVRSIRKTRDIFEAHCVPLSGVVFNQEGQAGPGRQRVLLEEGYNIGVFPKNLFRYAQGEVERWPYYLQEGGDLVVGPSGYDPNSGIDVVWTFFDDGELRAVREAINPYAAPLGGRDQGRLDEYEARIQGLVDQGYKVSSITSYVEHLKAQGVSQPQAPSLVDGTWQPPSTDSIHRWLGGRSQFFVGAEEDIRVRSGNMRARTAAAATQVLYEELQRRGLDTGTDWAARMDRLWRNVWHSQVSDFSGVNPWRGEVIYGLRLNRWLLNETGYLRALFMETLGWSLVEINLAERSVSEVENETIYESPEAVATPPLEVEVYTPGRAFESDWYWLGNAHYLLDLHISEQVEILDSNGEEIDGGELAVHFPRTGDLLEYCPGLIEDEIFQQPLSDFNLLMDHLYLPLTNGLIGLGEGWYVIKETRLNHVAGRITPEPTIDFIDRSIPSDQPTRWQFHLLQASPAEALELANQINIHPTLIYSVDAERSRSPQEL